MSKKLKKPDYKARLEHKLYLARENPEPIFDLSECDLRQVPSGTYSLCRVFLKEALLLGCNRLESFSHGGSLADLKQLVVLDIQKNNFHTLPDDIKLLINLRELYMNDNHVKKLPESVTLLYNLRILDVRNNALHKLPETLGNLAQLSQLLITGNKHLIRLPKSICGVHKMQQLDLDAERFVYPPSDICQNGLTSVIEYIANDCGIPYVPTIPPKTIEEVITTGKDAVLDTKEFQEKFLQLEKLKEQRQQNLLRIEKHNELLTQQELKLHDEKRADKKKLLQVLTKQQSKLDLELVKIQHERDLERQQLINELQDEESKAEESINRLLEMSGKPQFIEYEAHEGARLLEIVSRNSTNLCREEILESMRTTLEQSSRQFDNYWRERNATVEAVLREEQKANLSLTQELEKHKYTDNNLINELEENNRLQMAAVAALLEKSDAHTWSLMQEVNLVSEQLAKLTSIELDKRKLELDAQLNDLSEKRIELSTILLDLLAQQAARRDNLLSTLRKLELEHNSDDFWLLQYQKLIERRPELVDQLQQDLDPILLNNLLMAGVIHCLPFLARWGACSIKSLAELTDEDLLEAGVSKELERQKILTAIHEYIKLHGVEKPSAPPVEDEASAPPIVSEQVINPPAAITTIECVICMDLNCTVLYIPCGHLCTCVNCGDSVDLCPLCRTPIDNRIRVLSA